MKKQDPIMRTDMRSYMLKDIVFWRDINAYDSGKIIDMDEANHLILVKWNYYANPEWLTPELLDTIADNKRWTWE